MTEENNPSRNSKNFLNFVRNAYFIYLIPALIFALVFGLLNPCKTRDDYSCGPAGLIAVIIWGIIALPLIILAFYSKNWLLSFRYKKIVLLTLALVMFILFCVITFNFLIKILAT